MLKTTLGKLQFPKDGATWSKLGAIFCLQIAHDLPNALTATMAPTLFVKRFGMPLEYLGLFFLPFVVTALKWTWAPIVDNRGSEKFGRRKSWLAPLTVLVSLSYLAIALIRPGLDTLFIIIALLMVKQVFYSTQEIAADAYVVENLTAEERGLGSSIVWLGKEIGQVIGFAGLLFVADRFGWTAAFTAAAVLFALFNLPALLRKETHVQETESQLPARVMAFFERRVNWRIMSVVFAIAFTVQMPVAVIGPFLSSKGLTLSEIGVALGISASLGAIISLSIASVVISRIGAKRMAILMLFIAPLAAPAFIWLAAQETVSAGMVIAIILWATICNAPVRMAFYAARIGWTSSTQVATDMTAQQSTWFLGYAAAGAVAGVLAAQVGWVLFFILNTVATALAIIYFIRSHDGIEEEVTRWRNVKVGA